MADLDALLDPDQEDNPVGFGVGDESLIPATADSLDELDVDRAAQQVGDVGDAAAASVGTLPPTSLADQGVDAVSGGAAPDATPPAPAVVTQPAVSSSGTPTQGVNPVTAPTSEGVVARQSEVDKALAAIQAQTAQAQAEAAKQAQQEQAAEQADYLKRRQAAQEALDAKTKAFEGMKLEDPSERRNSFKSVLAVIFGGLGAAFRSAGGGDSTNTGLQALQQKWQQQTEIQKANIAAARDQVIQARTRLGDVEEGRNLMRREADARLLSKYNLALKQGEAQLRNQGVTQAGIDADKRIIQLREGKVLAEQKARAAEDEHALKQAKAAQLQRLGGTPDDLRQAQIRVMNARAQLLERKGKGGAGGGGAGNARDQAVAKYLIENPGDIPGAMQVAGPGFDSKRFDKIVTQTKGTEGQNKNAHQAKIGLDAINAIEASGYTPNKNDIQRWLNNSRLVNLANREGIVGGGAALAQTFGAIPQSEVEGLSPDAAAYFGNVRRYMETIGRAQSGAAISPSEWTNFFNQYGPNSRGGLDAARQYLQDQFKISGVAGRSLGAGGETKPAKTGGFPPKGQTRKLGDGRTVKFTDDEGGYVVVSSGRR